MLGSLCTDQLGIASGQFWVTMTIRWDDTNDADNNNNDNGNNDSDNDNNNDNNDNNKNSNDN